jgi:hypothetical protein
MVPQVLPSPVTPDPEKEKVENEGPLSRERIGCVGGNGVPVEQGGS